MSADDLDNVIAYQNALADETERQRRKLYIILRCERCNNEKEVPRHEYDPPDAIVCLCSECPDCERSGEFGQCWYYDAAGKETSGDPMTFHERADKLRDSK